MKLANLCRGPRMEFQEDSSDETQRPSAASFCLVALHPAN
jgi:hypothetical protein